MRETRIIAKSDMQRLLADLLKAQEVVAPVMRDGMVSYESITDASQVDLEQRNSKRPPKETFFPRSEVLFTYAAGKMAAAPLDERKRVILGMRSCDARSLDVMDKVFAGSKYQDPYYMARRMNTTLVGLGCSDPLSTCFCTSVGGDPFSPQGLDVLLTDLGDHYLVEELTERGVALLEGSPYLRDASEQDCARKAEIAVQARDMRKVDTSNLKAKLDAMFGDDFWSGLYEKCLGCAACSYLCPTCHCFDIADESSNGTGRRVRHWDSCQFALFTSHASGHNPRPSGKERMRQRVMHKFDYFVSNYGEQACVGCGRCVRECPANLDIRAVLEAICES